MKRMGGSLGKAARPQDGVVTALHDPGLPRLAQALDVAGLAPRNPSPSATSSAARTRARSLRYSLPMARAPSSNS